MFLTRIVRQKVKASEVLTAFLDQSNPIWTSYFVKLSDVQNDQWGRSHFNWTLKSGANFHILRTTCWPYIKYHCTRNEIVDLKAQDNFFRFLKVINLGIPMLFYGIAAIFLIRHTEIVNIPKSGQKVKIYFLLKEDKGSRF
jgi:hypothetical protein